MMSARDSTATFTSLLGAQPSAVARTVGAHMAIVVAKLREFAPYAALELVMPGGSLMALGLWLYRRRRNA